MSDLVEALLTKVNTLVREREALITELTSIEDRIVSCDGRISVMAELIKEEGGEVPTLPKPWRRQRTPSPNRPSPRYEESVLSERRSQPHPPTSNQSPKKQVHIPDDDLLLQASSMSGTDPEIAERLAKRRISQGARVQRRLGPGIHAGASKEEVRAASQGNHRHMAVDDNHLRDLNRVGEKKH